MTNDPLPLYGATRRTEHRAHLVRHAGPPETDAERPGHDEGRRPEGQRPS